MDLAFSFRSDTPLPLHRQLYEQIRAAILAGHLRPQQRLPSSRALAQSLRISRSTVSLSYEQLLSEGYLQTAVGSGTFVCAQLPDLQLQAIAPPRPSAPSATLSSQIEPALEPTLEPTTVCLSDYGQRLAAQPPWQPEPSAEIHFRYGRSDMERFPLALWRKLLTRRMQASLDWMDYTDDTLGYQPLREAIAQYLCRARALSCTPDQVLITHGTQQAIQLIAQLFLNPGDSIAMENPGYVSSRKIFQSRGVNVFPIPVDADGIQVEMLTHQTSSSIRLVCVTPSHQFPTGALLSLPRRFQLLAWARHQGALIIEDDYDSEYRYSSRPIPALQGLEPQSPVIYTGTFAKMLFPGLRIGYVVLPKIQVATGQGHPLNRTLIEIFGQARWSSDRHSSRLDQAVLADFIHEGHLDRHIRRMRLCYAGRQRALLTALQEHLGDRVRIFGEAAGLHVMIQLFFQLDADNILACARAAGVGLVDARPHYQTDLPEAPTFILGYAELEEGEIIQGIQRLAIALRNRESITNRSLTDR